MASNFHPELTKEYAFRIVAVADVQSYLNEQALQDYVLINKQPFIRKIKDTPDGTMEEVQTYSITMERQRKIFPASTIGTTSLSIENPPMIPQAQSQS